MQELGDVAEGEAVVGAERQDDGVVVGRRLELEVEAAAQALAQGQAEGPVDAPAVWGVDYELLAAGVVEEALEHDVGVGGDGAEGGLGRGDVGNGLLGDLGFDSVGVGELLGGLGEGGVAQGVGFVGVGK